MIREDILLLQRCKEALDDLQSDYQMMGLNVKELPKSLPQHDIHLEILTCETIIDDCKLEIEKSSLEEIVEVVKVVYHVDLNKLDQDNGLLKLDAVISKFLSSSKHKKDVDELVLARFREDMNLILGIKDMLQHRVDQLHKEKTWFIFSNSALIKEYEQYLSSFTDIEMQMLTCFSFMSEMVTSYIVESFHYIYLYFSYLIKYFIGTGNQLVLVEIAASIDRFINIMQPLVKETSLKNENLRNFYVIYELNVLKEQIIEHYE